MGALHPIEQGLTFFLAFGPFVLLAAVVWLRRRADAAADTDDSGVSERSDSKERSET